MIPNHFSEKLVRLFVACPSDVAQEREAVEQAASHVSKQRAYSTIKVLRWEDGPVDEETQGEAEKHGPEPDEAMDVFVLVLWQKYGAITNCDGLSRTERAFRKAWSARQATGKPAILAYFCTVGTPLLDIDLEQAKHLQSFVADLKDKGLLRPYADRSQFATMFEDHLQRTLNELADPRGVHAGPRLNRQHTEGSSRLLEQIHLAQSRISHHIFRTPLLRSRRLEQDLKCKKLLFKLECLQLTGSFKVRGAMNAVLAHRETPDTRPFATASAGNHGLGLAYSESRFKREAIIYMPERTPLTKRKAIERYTSQITLKGKSFDETKTYAIAESQANNYRFIHPFNDMEVIAGQGTLGLDLLDDVKEYYGNEPPDVIVLPVGGGGLIAGVGTVVREYWPDTQIVGAEAWNVSSLDAAMKEGRPRAVVNEGTFADGIAVSEIGDQTFPVIREVVDEVWRVSEESIAKAVIRLIEDVRIISEGAGACGLGGLLDRSSGFASTISNRSVLVVISGGNIDTIALDKLLQRGLVLSKRLAHFRFTVEDIPGSLARLTTDFAELQVNILDLWHSRLNAYVRLGTTHVDTVVETRDAAHVDSVLEALVAKGHNVELLTK